MARALRGSLVLLAGWATLLAATGWLYILRPAHGAGGVSIREALPLDELSGRAGVPLATFLGVWAGAALIMGLLARTAGVERLTAALLLAAAVGTWQLLASGASLVVVRQIPAHEALDAAVRFRPIYAAALLAGLAGAICGRRRFSLRSRAPSLLAVGVAAAGTLGLIAAVFVLHHHSVVAVMPPSRLRPLTHALAAPLSVALLLAAKELARRKRRAWQVSLVLLGGAAVLHLLHGLDAGVALAGSLALALVACRHEFDALGDPASRPRLAVRAPLLGAGLFAYGAVLLWLNQLAIDRPYSLGFAARETGAALVGLRLDGSAHLTGSFGEWFPLSVFLAGLAACGWLLLAWFGPWRYRQREEARERRLAHDLVATWGADTLAPFALRSDNSYFFSEDERSFIAYRVVGGVAIVSGDPIGRAGQDGELLTGSSPRPGARLEAGRPGSLRAASRPLPVARPARPLPRRRGGGRDRALLARGPHDPQGPPVGPPAAAAGVSLRGAPARRDRPGTACGAGRGRAHVAWRRARKGVRHGAGHALPARRRRGAVRRRARSRRAAGRVPPLRGLSRRLRALAVVDAAPALDAERVQRVARLRDRGLGEGERRRRVLAQLRALRRAPGAGGRAVTAAEPRAASTPTAEGALPARQPPALQPEVLPSWQRRFIVYERRLDLPRVGIAALAAESYLPFSGRGAQ
jgi:lysylphosphatidylglycerol synthetase-like protein (DUF2156 family)